MSTETIDSDAAVREVEDIIGKPITGSHFVFLRREEPDESHLPKELISGAKIRLGPTFMNRQPYRNWPVGSLEEKQYLSIILPVSPTSEAWDAAVKKYYTELRINVPFEGRPFEIGVDAAGKPLSITDFIEYSWAKGHPHVAETLMDMRRLKTKRFYIQDPLKDVARKNDDVKLRMRADREFIKATDNSARKRNLLRVLGSARVETLADESIENMLFDIKTSSPKKFLEAAMDPNLDINAEIATFIEYKVLTKIGNSILFQDETLADTLDECIKYMKNPKNSGTLNTLRAKLKENLK